MVKVGKKFLPFLVSVFFGAFYVFFQSPGVSGGDAGDLVAAAAVRGVAHPPGYPLYTLLGWLLTKLPIGSTVAFRVGLLSSIPAGLSVGLAFLIFRRVTKSNLISLLTCFSLSFNYLFWVNAEVQEVFGLHLFFLFATLFLVLEWLKKPRLKIIYWLSLIVGLEFSHHHTYLLIFPALIFIFFINPKTRLKKSYFSVRFVLTNLLLFLLGASIYGYVFWASAGNPPINWDQVSDWPSFIRLITRADYGTFVYTTGAGISLKRGLLSTLGLVHFLVSEFGLLGLSIIILGGLSLYEKKKPLFYFCFLWFIFTGIVFQFYAGFPLGSLFALATVERFYLLPYPALFLCLAFGFWRIKIEVEKLLAKASFLKLRVRQLLLMLLPIFFLLYPLRLFLVNLEKNDLRDFDYFEKYGERMLNSCLPGSIFIPFGDLDAFISRYLYFVQGYRSDLRILSGSSVDRFVIDGDDLTQEESFLDVDQDDPDSFWAEVQSSIESRQFDVCTTKQLNLPDNFLLYPRGLAFVYVRQDSPNNKDLDEIEKENQAIWQSYSLDDLINQRAKREAYFLENLVGDYYEGALNIYQFFLEKGDYKKAKGWLEKLTEIRPGKETLIRSGFLIDVQVGECDSAKTGLDQYQSVITSSEGWLLLEALYEKECLGDSQKHDQIIGLMKEKGVIND
ncbi:protein O-mannosyl-transferase family [Patescibacteria group bacterium]